MSHGEWCPAYDVVFKMCVPCFLYTKTFKNFWKAFINLKTLKTGKINYFFSKKWFSSHRYMTAWHIRPVTILMLYNGRLWPAIAKGRHSHNAIALARGHHS